MSQPKQPKKQSKSTQAELIQRVSEVREQLLSGFTRSDIVQYGAKWSVQERQIDDYIAMAKAQIQEIAVADATTDISILIRNLWDLYRKAIKEGNISEGHKITMSLAKLRGYDQVTVNHKFERSEEHAKMSDADLEAAMAAAMQERH